MSKAMGIMGMASIALAVYEFGGQGADFNLIISFLYFAIHFVSGINYYPIQVCGGTAKTIPPTTNIILFVIIILSRVPAHMRVDHRFMSRRDSYIFCAVNTMCFLLCGICAPDLRRLILYFVLLNDLNNFGYYLGKSVHKDLHAVQFVSGCLVCFVVLGNVSNKFIELQNMGPDVELHVCFIILATTSFHYLYHTRPPEI
jgi:hypothetical protein